MTVSNLPYKLFCQQKKFSLYRTLLKNPETTYEQFREFLLKRSIAVPDEEYFNQVREKALEDMPKVDTVPEEEVSKPEVKPKTTRKRRGRKSASKNSN